MKNIHIDSAYDDLKKGNGKTSFTLLELAEKRQNEIDKIVNNISEQYKNLSSVDKKKFDSLNVITGGMLGSIAKIDVKREYGDIPSTHVGVEFAKSSLMEPFRSGMISVIEDKKPLREFLQIMDNPDMKLASQIYKNVNDTYRKITKNCLTQEDLETGGKLLDNIKEKLIATKDNLHNFSNKEGVFEFKKEYIGIVKSSVEEVKGANILMEKTTGVKNPFENMNSKMNSKLEGMCENFVDKIKNETILNKNKLF